MQAHRPSPGLLHECAGCGRHRLARMYGDPWPRGIDDFWLVGDDRI